MPDPSTLDWSGDAIPAALVEDNLGSPLRIASQIGTLVLSDGSTVSPVSLFEQFGANINTSDANVFVIIVNSMPAPLCLVESLVDHGSQIYYPATMAPGGGSVRRGHQIPAAIAHPDPARSKEMLTGVGLYNFTSNFWRNTGVAMRFSYKDGDAGPQVGVTFLDHPSTFHDACAAVTADISAYGNLQSFYDNTANSYSGKQYDIGSEATIWGTFDNVSSGTIPKVLTVWLRPWDM